MMEESGVKQILESKPAYFFYMQTNELAKFNEFKSWNRPVHSWKLSCESEGKTRDDALS